MAHIDPFALAIFVLGTTTASFVTGLAGFAFGLVAAAIWLYALTPIQTTTLIVAYGLLVQGYAVWKLRHSINVSRLTPLRPLAFRLASCFCDGYHPRRFGPQSVSC